ncbi:hypothetical protein ACLQ25_09680 [Micromonospora sp. DT44]|uniref:hypothetical protein n=1 Tax=Micromonospora sp. DT44 TaxID=3393439 RepID=UPI003CECB609
MQPQTLPDQQTATVRVAFDVNAGIEPLTFPSSATTAEITDRLRAAFLAADVIRDGHRFAVTIENTEMGIGTVNVLVDGRVIEHGSITRIEPEPPRFVVTRVEPDPRQRFIAGLRAAADFYEANTTMPIPLYPNLVVHAEGDDETQAEQVRVAAELLGVEPERTGRRGHFRAQRYFGPIEVGVLHIPAATMADHALRQSYSANIHTGQVATR